MSRYKIIYLPLLIRKSVFVDILDRMYRGMGLIIRIANLGVEELILINEFLHISLILVIISQPINQIHKVHSFGKRVGFGSGIADIPLGVEVFGDLHDLSRRHAQLVSRQFL